jgi:ankyrin repeat protein
VYLAGRPQGASARNLNNVSALMYALYRRNHEAVKMLRDRLLSLDLWEASALGETGTVRALTNDAACKIDALSPDGFSALQLAAFFGRPGVVEVLLERGAGTDVVSQNVQGICALHGACVGRHYEIVKMLLAAGANRDLAQANGQTALDIAIKSGDEHLVKILTNKL